MNTNRSKGNSPTLTDAELEGYRQDAFDPQRAEDLAVGRRLAQTHSLQTMDEYLRFLADLQRIFGEFDRSANPTPTDRNVL